MNSLITQRTFIARLVFLFILLSLLYSFLGHTLLHQFQAPVLKFPYVDLSYWLIHLAGIPEFITGKFWVALVFDMGLVVFCLLAILKPASRIYPSVFFILFAVYYFIYNSYGAHHTHSKIGILLMPIPFMFSRSSFAYLWQGMRYFLLFSYSAAFFWKLFRSSWLHENQGVLILKKNLVFYLYQHPETALTHFYQWLLQHPGLVNGIFILGFIAEGCFLIGFFTRRFDKYLLALSLLLPVGFFFLADAFLFELLILSLTLINFNRQRQSNQRLSLLNSETTGIALLETFNSINDYGGNK